MTGLPPNGAVIRQKYRIERTIGRGGMAVVFEATHLLLSQSVALKVLRPDIPRGPGVVDRFLREARAASRLQGPHVARVLDVDAFEDGSPFIVMELLQGTDLLALLGQRRLSAREAVSYVRQACEALAEAHAMGIIHRDVKPANLFLVQGRSGEGTIKVLDFGISKVVEDTRLTAENVGMGSAEYMSPEQIRSAKDVDPRSDIWSLGVTLYELLTGHTPFHESTTSAVLAAVLTRPAPQPRHHRPDLPAGLEAIVMRCLEPEPAKRFGSVTELSQALLPFENAVTAPSPTAPKKGRTIPPQAFLAAGMVLLIAGVLLFGLRPKALESPRFSLQDEELVDHQTHLVWQRRAAQSAMSYTAAEKYCARLGPGLRLPTVDELLTFMAVTELDPPIDPHFVSVTPVDVFWSKTPAGDGAMRVVFFSTGLPGSSAVSTLRRVRCLREESAPAQK